MSETWVDAEDYEDIGEGAYDSEDIGEAAYDSEDVGEEFGEESRSARRQRERQRQRQIMLARQRQAQLRRQRRPPQPARRPVRAPDPGRPAIRAVRSLDLETKVGLDSLRRALEESNRRANRATWAAVAGSAVDQGLDAFSTNLTNQYLRAGARFAPLLFLSPAKRKGGAEGFVTDPRFIGGASILGIALLHNFTSTVHSVLISPHEPVTTTLGPTAAQTAVIDAADAAVAAVPDTASAEVRTTASAVADAVKTAASAVPAAGTTTKVPGTLVATAKDRLGNPIKNMSFQWGSSDPALVFADSLKGDFMATVTKDTPRSVTVTATALNGKQGTQTVLIGP